MFALLVMLRTRRKKTTTGASGAQPGMSTRRSRRTKQNGEETDGRHTIMGSVWSRIDQINQENLNSLQVTETTMNGISTQTLPPPEAEDSKTCPKCSSPLKPAVVPAGCTSSLLQCSQCSATLLCKDCLYPCPEGTCTNQSCKAVALLLTCDRVTDLRSRVYGCPLFRACPKCHNIMMHQSGCKYVQCGQCSHRYCFICLRVSKECRKDDMYWSLTCTTPRAARQRFQT